MIATGGGAGGGTTSNNAINGQSGGSGGGNCYYGAGTVGGSGTVGQGFPGGASSSVNGSGYETGGGGGGAGAIGGNGTNTGTGSTSKGGNGGAGLQFGISGTTTYYAGGGGGGNNVNANPNAGTGGNGGGGNGGIRTSLQATSGTANTGGGGGGGGADIYGSGSGGSGVVIIRYTTTAVANTSDSTTDNLVDSPTLYGHDYGNGGEVVGNYCTMNPLVPNTNSTAQFQNGNLTVTTGPAANTSTSTIGTIGVSSGKWYWECVNTVNTSGINYVPGFGITNAIVQTGYNLNSTNQQYYLFGNGNLQSLSTQISNYGPAFTIGDVIGIALDLVNNQITFYKNGVAGTPYTIPAGTYWPWYAQNTNSAGTVTSSFNFGQRAWQYTPPAGFSALTTKNLIRPTIVQPNQHFAVTSWTGTGATQNISLNFQPDLIWCKRLDSSANYPIIQNTITGITYSSGTNATDQPGNYSAVASVSASGFTLGTTNDSNASGSPYIGYAWRAASSSSSVTTGTITSTVRANPTAGFALVGWTGNGAANATIGHGLGTTPAMIWNKVNNGTDEHRCWHQGLFQGIDSTGYMWNLASQLAPVYDSQRVTGADSNNFRVVGNTAPYMNATGYNYTAYVWAPVAGFSSFGTYTANASTDGPFVYCGFKPAFVLVKNTSRGSLDTPIIDSVQNTYNPTTYAIFANNSNAQSSTYYIDFLSNGFKFRVGSGSVMNNTAGDVYIYAAFAASPFGNTNGTAR